MLPKIIQLRLIKLRRQNRVSQILQILQARAQARDHRIRPNPQRHHALERGKPIAELARNQRMVQEIPIAVPSLAAEDLPEHVGDVVGFDDAAGAPDGDDGGEVDAPPVFAVGLVDDVDALDKGAEEGDVDGFAEVFEDGLLLGGGEVELFDGEAAAECFFDVLAVGLGAVSWVDSWAILVAKVLREMRMRFV